jgi:hypothetical protein
MKKTYTTTVIGFMFFAILCTTGAQGQGFTAKDKIPHDISYYRETRATPPLVKVLYGRPSKNEQEIFGNLIPYGKIWRTGYNEATEIKFFREVAFGGKTVPAGTYVLLSIPGEKEWELILSSNLDVWGAFQYDPAFDVARITVPVTKAETLEIFSISFKKKNNKIEMLLGWDATRIKIPLKFKKQQYLAVNEDD